MKEYEEAVRLIGAKNPDDVVNFKPSASTLGRAAELLRHEEVSELTIEERRELDGFEKLELSMNLGRAQARQLLAHGK
jgi:hypothetical protein